MHKRGRCRQYILISGQQLVSDLSVMQAGTQQLPCKRSGPTRCAIRVSSLT